MSKDRQIDIAKILNKAYDTISQLQQENMVLKVLVEDLEEELKANTNDAETENAKEKDS